MNQQLDEAKWRVASLAKAHRDAAVLARYASLAVRVDTPLLRRLRLCLIPSSDASAEADLWFSHLSESRGDSGLVFESVVAEVLREELATEQLIDGRRAIDAVWEITAAAHADWPASLRLEEEITYLALSKAAGDDIQEALRPALVAMASGEQRAAEVARWAARAMPRLPQTARAGEAAITLAVAAMAVLGTGSDTSGGVVSMPPDMGWVLPATVFSRRVRLACELSRRSLRFRRVPDDAPANASTVDLPLTRPLLLELGWTLANVTSTRLVTVRPDEPVPVPEGWTDLRLRTLDGALYSLSSSSSSVDLSFEDPLRACARVECGSSRGRGVVVAPGRMLTTLHVVQDARNPTSTVPEDIYVMYNGRRISAQLGVADSRVDLALLSVGGLSGAVIPRSAEVRVPDPVTLVAEGESPSRPILLAGVITAVELESSIDGRRYRDLLEIQLDRATWSSLVPGLSGSPFVRKKAMVGLLGWGDDNRVLATSVETIDRFLSWALRPGEHSPEILFSHAPQEPDDTRTELGESAIDRVARALRTAHLQPWTMGNPTRSDVLPLGPMELSGARGAVCLLTPAESIGGAHAQQEMATIAFRRWADPDFPIALVADRRSGATLPELLQSIVPISLNDVDDDELWQQLQETLDGVESERSPLPDEARFDAAVKALDLPPDGPFEDLAIDLASTGQDLLLRTETADEMAVETAELAAMTALPSGSTLVQLRQIAQATAGERAVYLNAMPKEYARLLLKKAWYPRSAPPQVVIRDQEWPPDANVSDIVNRIRRVIADAIGAREPAARWVMSNVPVTFVVIFVTRPLPSRAVVSALHAQMPGALLFFLGSVVVDARQAAAAGVQLLPALPPDAAMAWLQRYKRLMNQVAPRDSGTVRSKHIGK